MTKRRYIFVGIPLACLLCIIVSLIISHPKKGTEHQKENSLKEDASAHKQMQGVSGTDTLTQTVQGLSIPKYGEDGREILMLRGKNTFLLNNTIYKIIAPERSEERRVGKECR